MRSAGQERAGPRGGGALAGPSPIRGLLPVFERGLDDPAGRDLASLVDREREDVVPAVGRVEAEPEAPALGAPSPAEVAGLVEVVAVLEGCLAGRVVISGDAPADPSQVLVD